MPYIDENHLVNLHKTIESKEIMEERLIEELQKNRQEKEELYRSKNRFKWSAISLATFILLGIVLYVIKPSLYVSDTYLQTENKLLIDKEELKEYHSEASSKKTAFTTNSIVVYTHDKS